MEFEGKVGYLVECAYAGGSMNKLKEGKRYMVHKISPSRASIKVINAFDIDDITWWSASRFKIKNSGMIDKNEEDKPELMCKGDTVEVIDPGHTYSDYSDWAKVVSATKWKRFNRAERGKTGYVVAIHKHLFDKKLLALVDIEGKEIIIDIAGLKKIGGSGMKDCISKNYETTEDALLVQKHFNNELNDNFTTQLIVESYRAAILKEAERREDAEEEKKSK